MSYPDSLSYPVDEIESVATFIVTDGGQVPDVVFRWATGALADVAVAAGQTALFGAPGLEVDDDWMPIR